MQAMGLSTTGSVSYGAAEEKLKDVVIKVMSSLYKGGGGVLTHLRKQ